MKLSEPIAHYLQTSSTQDEAKKALSGIHWTTDQTAGKGRFDRQWYSEPEQSLAVSIALPNLRMHPKPYLIGMWIGLALAEALELKVQWPNDLILNGKKVCGILSEVTEGIPIIGFGLNVGKMTFPSEISNRATSLANEGIQIGNPTEVFDQILKLLGSLDEPPHSWPEMAKRWQAFDATPGKIFKLQDGRVGIADGISNEAELIWNHHGHYEMVTCADALWGINNSIGSD
jgi:BirA family biotin operon repressor/biotin-[acetyl-CoA-carboxylase] ligase